MIGILAGMGPFSTAPFIDRLMKSWQEHFNAHYDIDFPHVLIYSLPTPFYLDREVDHLVLERSIITGALKLQSAGVDFIAMPCGSAHRYFEAVKSKLNIELLNMLELSITNLTDLTGKAQKIAVLATDSTISSGLYQRALEQKGLAYINSMIYQKDVNALIHSVKCAKETNYLDVKAVNLLEKLKKENVKTALIACTELSECFSRIIHSPSYQNKIDIIDASDALVKGSVFTGSTIKESALDLLFF
ncbi:aspartate/glutamate racemase family protein [Fangia hongkongensis]|nr:amino acid racemase [Fangia hongkongensis]